MNISQWFICFAVIPFTALVVEHSLKLAAPNLPRPSSAIRWTADKVGSVFETIGRMVGSLFFIPKAVRWFYRHFREILDKLWPFIKDFVESALDLVRPTFRLLVAPLDFFKGYAYGWLDTLSTYAQAYLDWSYLVIGVSLTGVAYMVISRPSMLSTVQGFLPSEALPLGNLSVLFLSGACSMCIVILYLIVSHTVSFIWGNQQMGQSS